MKKIHGKISIVLLMLLSLIIFAVCSSVVFGVSARSGAVASADNGQHIALAATASSDADEKIQLITADVADEAESDIVDTDTEEADSSADKDVVSNWLIWFLVAVIILILLVVETFFFIQLSRKPKKVEEKKEQNPDVIIIETVQTADKVSDKD